MLLIACPEAAPLFFLPNHIFCLGIYPLNSHVIQGKLDSCLKGVLRSQWALGMCLVTVVGRLWWACDQVGPIRWRKRCFIPHWEKVSFSLSAGHAQGSLSPFQLLLATILRPRGKPIWGQSEYTQRVWGWEECQKVELQPNCVMPWGCPTSGFLLYETTHFWLLKASCSWNFWKDMHFHITL